MWCSSLAARCQRRAADARRGQAASLDDDRRARSVGRARRGGRRGARPSRRRRWSGHGDVAAEADEHAGPAPGGRSRARRDRRTTPWPSPRGRARRLRHRDVFATRSTWTARQPGTVVTTRGSGGPVTCDELEVAVVAEHPQDAPDRRVDEAVGRGRRCERDVHARRAGWRTRPRGGRRPGSPRDRSLSSRNRLQATSTAATSGRDHLGGDVEDVLLRDDDGTRAERRERRAAECGDRRAHDPPVVAAALWWCRRPVVTGGCAGGRSTCGGRHRGHRAAVRPDRSRSAAGQVSGATVGRHGRRLVGSSPPPVNGVTTVVVGWHRLRGSGRRRDHREDADAGDAAGGDPAGEPAEALRPASRW